MVAYRFHTVATSKTSAQNKAKGLRRSGFGARVRKSSKTLSSGGRYPYRVDIGGRLASAPKKRKKGKSNKRHC